MLRLTSSAFEESARIPKKFTGEGQDVYPMLSWSGVPAGTKQLALICDDPDAPMSKPFVHWVAYGIPADWRSLPEGDVEGITEGQNDFGNSGYGGPMPPPGHGVHHYHFKLYALDEQVDLDPGATKKELLQAMEGHILEEADLVGTYER